MTPSEYFRSAWGSWPGPHPPEARLCECTICLKKRNQLLEQPKDLPEVVSEIVL